MCKWDYVLLPFLSQLFFYFCLSFSQFSSTYAFPVPVVLLFLSFPPICSISHFPLQILLLHLTFLSQLFFYFSLSSHNCSSAVFPPNCFSTLSFLSQLFFYFCLSSHNYSFSVFPLLIEHWPSPNLRQVHGIPVHDLLDFATKAYFGVRLLLSVTNPPLNQNI